MAITVNAGFIRYGGRNRNEIKNVVGVELPFAWSDDHVNIRKALYEHVPKGEGWVLTGYCLVEKPRDVRR